MKKHFLRIGTLMLVVSMVLISAVSVFAQPDSSAKTDFPSLFNGLGLSPEQSDKTMKLTKDFLVTLQESNQNLTNLMAPLASGSPADPKVSEKTALIQRQFGIKLEQYHLDLADAIGDDKALKIVENIHGIIPQVLLQGSGIAIGNHNAHGLPTGTSQPNSGGTTNNTGNVPSVPNMSGMPNMSNSNNIPMNNMPGMGSMNVMENVSPNVNVTPNTNMPNMSNMPIMNGNQPVNGNGLNVVNRQIISQLQASNAMLMQMLVAIYNQPNTGNLGAQIQSIYQMIANQSGLIQMLSANLNTGNSSMSMGSGNSTGMGMGMGNNNKMGMGNMSGMGIGMKGK